MPMHCASQNQEVVVLESFENVYNASAGEASIDVVMRTSEYDIHINSSILQKVRKLSDKIMLIDNFARLVVSCGGTIHPHPHAQPYFNINDYS